VPIRR